MEIQSFMLKIGYKFTLIHNLKKILFDSRVKSFILPSGLYGWSVYFQFMCHEATQHTSTPLNRMPVCHRNTSLNSVGIHLEYQRGALLGKVFCHRV